MTCNGITIFLDAKEKIEESPLDLTSLDYHAHPIRKACLNRHLKSYQVSCKETTASDREHTTHRVITHYVRHYRMQDVRKVLSHSNSHAGIVPFPVLCE